MQALEETVASAATTTDMTTLSHIVEPRSLLLTWQPADEHSPNRMRRTVARISKAEDGTISFKYLSDTEDFREARAAGFQGHPAFKLEERETTTGVMDALLRRLPPRKREDFSDFLALHRLPNPFTYSDFALLGYTGARLPSDGFAVVPDIDPTACPCDYILEVAGFRHVEGASVENLAVGDAIQFVVEDTNPHDAKAIAISHKGIKIGYVNRAIKALIQAWLDKHEVVASIERINGKLERPLVYVRVNVA